MPYRNKWKETPQEKMFFLNVCPFRSDTIHPTSQLTAKPVKFYFGASMERSINNWAKKSGGAQT